jgi:ribosomal protein S17E
MMKKNNKKCIVCQTEYTFCPSCSDFDHLPRWMNVYHDENCRNIFNVVSGYTHKRYTKEDAKELLKKCDLSNKHSFKENLNVLIDEILKEVNALQIQQDSLNSDITHMIAQREDISNSLE